MYNQELRLTTDNDVQSSMLGTYRKANGFYANTRNSLSRSVWFFSENHHLTELSSFSDSNIYCSIQVLYRLILV